MWLVCNEDSNDGACADSQGSDDSKNLENVSIESRIQDQSKICRQERYSIISSTQTQQRLPIKGKKANVCTQSLLKDKYTDILNILV